MTSTGKLEYYEESFRLCDKSRLRQGRDIKVPRLFFWIVRSGISEMKTLCNIPDSKELLGRLNAVLSYQPRCVLVDHRPMGQCGELTQCLSEETDSKPLWLLGLRAVVGNGEGVWDDEASSIVKQKYSGILWYGDPRIVRSSYRTSLKLHFGIAVHTIGYVSRALELENWGVLRRCPKDVNRIVVAITWVSHRTGRVLRELNKAVSLIGSQWTWDFFVPGTFCTDGIAKADNVRVSNLDPQYLSVLQRASVAVVFAGCNSILDLCWAQTPAVCVVREMENQEQILHSKELQGRIPRLRFVDEHCIEAQYLVQLLKGAADSGWVGTQLEDAGAERAASFITSKLTSVSA
jgi:predicted glycosyltransferase